MSDQLTVRINSPEKFIWEGTAVSVSSANDRGPFDILPMHANFVTLIKKSPIRVNTGTEVKEFSFPNAVIWAHSNTVSIYTNIS
jgi:F0F1-type ATP synthase epsilon subunit